MKHIKRIVSLVLAIVMAMSLSACSFGEPTVESLFGVKTDITVEQKTIYEANGIKISTMALAEEIEKENNFISAYFYLKLEIENSTADEIRIYPKWVTVNDFMVGYGSTVNVDAGSTIEYNIDLSPANLEFEGISIVKDIEFAFNIGTYNEESDDYEFILTEPIAITTSADPNYVQPEVKNGVVAYSGDEAKIMFAWADKYSIKMYVENNLDQHINVMVSCASANGNASEYPYENIASIAVGKKGSVRVAYPRDFVDSSKSNEFVFNITIYDDSGYNVAFLQIIKDLGTITVTLDKFE